MEPLKGRKKHQGEETGVRQHHLGYDADDVGTFEAREIALPKGFGPWVVPGMGRGFKSRGVEVFRRKERRKFNIPVKTERRVESPWAAYGLRVGAHEMEIPQETLQEFVIKNPLVQKLREKHGVSIDNRPSKGIVEISRRASGIARAGNAHNVHRAFREFVELARQHAKEKRG